MRVMDIVVGSYFQPTRIQLIFLRSEMLPTCSGAKLRNYRF